MGYERIYLSTLPVQKTPPKSVESEPKRAGISRDLRDDLKRGNNRVSDPNGEWVLLQPFSCTKKDGGQRPVINLKTSTHSYMPLISKWREFIPSKGC